MRDIDANAERAAVIPLDGLRATAVGVADGGNMRTSPHRRSTAANRWRPPVPRQQLLRGQRKAAGLVRVEPVEERALPLGCAPKVESSQAVDRPAPTIRAAELGPEPRETRRPTRTGAPSRWPQAGGEGELEAIVGVRAHADVASLVIPASTKVAVAVLNERVPTLVVQDVRVLVQPSSVLNKQVRGLLTRSRHQYRGAQRLRRLKSRQRYWRRTRVCKRLLHSGCRVPWKVNVEVEPHRSRAQLCDEGKRDVFRD
mmetsp:Transcript_101250/g.285423  ORF Transcript_101250/g.285423 Transcript_101250/m.285423 type:complete len:256 (-) Transcript_101250:212-979(-)